jgi:regulator of cell morphogenesis and NO signaling
MQIEPGTQFQDLGKDYSKARRLFRRLGVDINSVNDQTIADVCDQAGISFKDFLRTLVAMSPENGMTPSMEDWARAPLADLVHYIQDRHHTYTRQELIRLGRVLEEALNKHGEQHPELQEIKIHFHHLREDLLKHLDMEDRIIFPSILANGADGRSPVFITLDDLHRMAITEHEAAEELFQNIAIITRNFSLPLEAVPAIRALYLGLRDLEEDLFVHIYLENHLLFPRSLEEANQAQSRS